MLCLETQAPSTGTSGWTDDGSTVRLDTSSDNVGIGAASAYAKLTVAGGSAIGTNYAAVVAPTDGLIIQGNVGIGTSSPETNLEVEGRIKMQEFQLGGATTPGLILKTDASGVGTWQDSGGSTYAWSRSGSTVRLTARSDSVGIGTSSPECKLHIFGADTAAGFRLLFQDGNTVNRLVLLNNGNLGIGTTAPGQKLVVADPGKKSLRVGVESGYVSLYVDDTEVARMW